MTAQPLLDAVGVRKLDRLYCRRYACDLSLRTSEPLARYLNLPKLPEMLSLSIVALTYPALAGCGVSRSAPPHDLRDEEGRVVAVKGTGPARWITVTMADRQADVLVWVDYGRRITAGSAVEVTAVRVCDGVIDAPDRLTRTQFTARVRGARTVLLDP